MSELIAKSMNGFRYDVDWDYAKSVEERSVMDLPNYFARDDALALWWAIKKYITGVIDIFYANDDDVKKDKELEQWMDELTK